MTQISQNRKKALLDIHRRMEGYSYVIMGSTALPVQGINVNAEDIDILTDSSGAYRLSTKYHEHIVNPVKYSKNGRFRSHYGQIYFGNHIIDVMGDLEIEVNGIWEKHDHLINKPTVIPIDGVGIPFVNTNDLLRIYRGLARDKDLAKIRAIWNGLRKPELSSESSKN